MAEVETDRNTAADFQDTVDSKIEGLGKGRYGRIFKMAHSPDKEEFIRTSKIQAIGILILGAVGFAIMWLMTYLPTYF